MNHPPHKVLVWAILKSGKKKKAYWDESKNCWMSSGRVYWESFYDSYLEEEVIDWKEMVSKSIRKQQGKFRKKIDHG